MMPTPEPILHRALAPSERLTLVLLLLILTGTVGEIVMAYLVLKALA